MDCTPTESITQSLFAATPGLPLPLAAQIVEARDREAVAIFQRLPTHYRAIDPRDAWAFAQQEAGREEVE